MASDLFGGENSSLMDYSVLMEEEYLFSMIGMSLIESADAKINEYATSTTSEDEKILGDDRASIRARCAATIRLEEKRSLIALKKKVLKILGQLDKDGEVDSDEMASSQQKRIKLM